MRAHAAEIGVEHLEFVETLCPVDWLGIHNFTTTIPYMADTAVSVVADAPDRDVAVQFSRLLCHHVHDARSGLVLSVAALFGKQQKVRFDRCGIVE